MAFYVDTSAFVKLVVTERHSAAMRRWAEANEDALFSSDLLRAEALRAARRHSPAAIVATRQWFDALTLVAITGNLCENAALLDPAILRTLDALHLAAALSIADELDGIATYDDRLAAAAGRVGIAVVAPH